MRWPWRRKPRTKWTTYQHSITCPCGCIFLECFVHNRVSVTLCAKHPLVDLHWSYDGEHRMWGLDDRHPLARLVFDHAKIDQLVQL